MKEHDTPRHPGPWRVMQLDSEFAGLLVAVGFLVMGFVSMPIATLFIVGAIALGVVVALLLRFTPRKYARVVVGAVIILAAVVLLWDIWEGHKPRPPPRPSAVSSNALYVLDEETYNRGYWLDCWFDRPANVDRCRLTDEDGKGLFEDVFLPCAGKEPIHGFAAWRGMIWSRPPDKRMKVPIVYVYDQVLFPQSFYEEVKGDVGCPPL